MSQFVAVAGFARVLDFGKASRSLATPATSLGFIKFALANSAAEADDATSTRFNRFNDLPTEGQ